MSRLSISAKLFLGAVAAAGVVTLGLCMQKWACPDHALFLVLLVLTVAASLFKVRLPGMTTTMSINVPLALIALVQLGFSQAVIIGGVSSAVQCLWRARFRPKPVQVVFNVCNTMNAVGLASIALRLGRADLQANASVVIAGGVLMLASTLPVAIIIGLTEGQRPWRVWPEIVVWTFPYYVLSACVAVTAGSVTGRVGWHTQLIILAVMYGVYRSYRRFVGNAVLQPAVAAGAPPVPEQLANVAAAAVESASRRG